MTTHSSPASGATTQQLVCHGPAGKPTTSTPRAYRGTSQPPIPYPWLRTRDLGTPHLPEDQWPAVARVNASLPAAVTSGAGCANSSYGPVAADVTRSSAQ